jgi:hypothetical protein
MNRQPGFATKTTLGKRSCCFECTPMIVFVIIITVYKEKIAFTIREAYLQQCEEARPLSAEASLARPTKQSQEA